MNAIAKEKIISLGLLLFAVIYCYGSLQLKLGVVANPGPGFVPLVVAVLLIVASSLHVYRLFAVKTEGKGNDSPTEKNMAPLCLGCFLILYPLLLSILDFVAATTLLVLGTLRILQYKNLVWSLVTAVLMSIITYVVFARILGVALPTGFIEIILMQIGG